MVQGWLALALVVVVACGGVAQDDPDAARADAAVADASAPDAVPADAAAPDAAPADAAPPDAPLTGETLLLSDTGLAMIYRVRLDGTVVDSWPSPVAGPTGVALDRRALDGFWVQGTATPTTVYKVGWNGTTITTRANPWGQSGASARGLDFYRDPIAAADDVLVVAHTNSTPVEAISGFRVSDGGAEFQAGFFMGGGFQSGFWGVHMVEYTESTNTMRSWMSRSTTDTIERWRTASFEAQFALAITEPRGLTMTPAGEFYVVDDATNTVVHLSATGTPLGSFPTPGTQPAGVSYVDGTVAPIP